MTEVIPAILPKNYEDLKNKIAMVRGIVPVVQVDICDGVFTRNITWPFEAPDKEAGIEGASLDIHFKNILNEQEGMPFWDDIDFELDLMVHDAIQNFDIYTKLGPKRILFHLEAVGEMEDFSNFLEGIDMFTRDMMEFGVAFNPSYPVENIYRIAGLVDCVQFMGNDKIGYQGLELDDKILEKIKILRTKYPDLPIAVDIGVNSKTAPLLVEAGVTKLVAGSAIFNSDDIIGAIENFQNL